MKLITAFCEWVCNTLNPFTNTDDYQHQNFCDYCNGCETTRKQTLKQISEYLQMSKTDLQKYSDDRGISFRYSDDKAKLIDRIINENL